MLSCSKFLWDSSFFSCFLIFWTVFYLEETFDGARQIGGVCCAVEFFFKRRVKGRGVRRIFNFWREVLYFLDIKLTSHHGGY